MSQQVTSEQTNTNSYSSTWFIAEMPTMVKNGIKELDDTGINYLEWKEGLFDLIGLITNIDEYLTLERNHIKGDHVIAAIIRQSVCFAIRTQLDRSHSAFQTFNIIKMMFCFPSRSTHLTIWKDILKAQLDNIDDLSKHIRKIKLNMLRLHHTGFAWTEDSFLSIALQIGLSPLYSNVNTILDARLRGGPERTITARETEEVIRAEAQRLSNPSADNRLNLAAR